VSKQLFVIHSTTEGQINLSHTATVTVWCTGGVNKEKGNEGFTWILNRSSLRPRQQVARKEKLGYMRAEPKVGYYLFFSI
jgi:hypothetical protein